MKPTSVLTLTIAVAAATSVIAFRPFAASGAESGASPIYGVTIPSGYRQWEAIAPSQEAGSLDELRIIFGNPIAMKAYRGGTVPFPDGAILGGLEARSIHER
jgi:hypothetical protein